MRSASPRAISARTPASRMYGAGTWSLTRGHLEARRPALGLDVPPHALHPCRVGVRRALAELGQRVLVTLPLDRHGLVEGRRHRLRLARLDELLGVPGQVGVHGDGDPLLDLAHTRIILPRRPREGSDFSPARRGLFPRIWAQDRRPPASRHEMRRRMNAMVTDYDSPRKIDDAGQEGYADTLTRRPDLASAAIDVDETELAESL